MDLAADMADAEVVFVGRLVSTNWFLSFRANRHKFRIEEQLKGQPMDEVIAWAPKQPAACGLDVDKRETLLVFVFSDPESDKAYVSGCGTYEIDDSVTWSERLQELRTKD